MRDPAERKTAAVLDQNNIARVPQTFITTTTIEMKNISSRI